MAQSDEATEATAPRWRWYDTLVALVGGVLGAIILGGLFTAVFFGVEDGVVDPAAQFWVIVPATSVSLIAATSLISHWRGAGRLADDFGFVVEPRDIRWVALGPVATVVLSAAAGAINSLFDLGDDNPQAIVEAVTDFRGTTTALAVVFSVAILGPIAEELVFRGLLLQTALSKGLRAGTASAISAAVFAIFHVADRGLISPEGAVTLTMLFALGYLLAYLRIRTGRLAASIFVHSGFNLTTVAVLFYLPALA